MKLRKDGTCASCGVALPAGSRAEWDSGARHTTCMDCVASRNDADTSGSTAESSTAPEIAVAVEAHSDSEIAPAETPEPKPAEQPESRTRDELVPEPIDTGVAGASARREHERREAKRNAKIEQTWGTGLAGKFAKAVSTEPQSTKAWAQGARGEERLAKILTKRLGERAVLLHDRRVPRTRGNIDHLAVASSGVWVIDAKQYKGKVEKRDVGKFFTADVRLHVGGRDRSKLVEGMGWQYDAVRVAMEDFGDSDIPIHLGLTFVDAEWSLFRRPMKFGDVLVAWPSKLAELIAAPGPVPPELVPDLARVIAERLPAQG